MKKAKITEEQFNEQYEAFLNEVVEFHDELLSRLPKIKELKKKAEKLHNAAAASFYEEHGFAYKSKGNQIKRLDSKMSKLLNISVSPACAEYRKAVEMVVGRF